MDIAFRTAKPGDMQAMQNLFAETIQHSCAKDYTPEQIAVWISTVQNKDRWKDLIASQYCILAIKGKRLLVFDPCSMGLTLIFCMYTSATKEKELPGKFT